VTTTVDVKDRDGSAVATVELPEDIFDVQANIPLMHQVVVAQLAAARQGTHKTKTRGEVSGGGRKPYKQKGTGRARQGSIRAPQFTGGGVVHGPVPRDYSQRVNKKMKAAALRGALSDRARAGVVHVVDTFVEGETPRTRDARAALAAVTDASKVLVVLSADDHLNWVSLRNLPEVHLIDSGQLNTYDVLYADVVLFTAAALDEFLGVPAARTEIVPDEDEVSLAKGDKAKKADKAEKADKADKAEKAEKADAKKAGGKKADKEPVDEVEDEVPAEAEDETDEADHEEEAK
jgi:large subunit ribosomal protein L4